MGTIVACIGRRDNGENNVIAEDVMKGVISRIWLVLLVVLLLVAVETCEKGPKKEARKMGSEVIRQMANAGTFYPADPQVLSGKVEDYLEGARVASIKGELIALICPHAGYPYSGHVAAAAYKQLIGKDYKVVVIIAPSHVEFFRGASVYDGDAYQTPLGTVYVDKELAARIAAQSPKITLSSHGHWTKTGMRQEHSLEVQIPFLQKTLKGFKIIPIVMGDQSYATCEALGETLAKVLSGQKALIVASSDLSHFHPYDEAVRLDRIVLRHIEAFDYRGLSGDLERGICEACGGGPIVTAMIAARHLGADRSTVALYANSGDVTGDRGSVVGYLAALIYKSTDEGTGERKVGIDMGLSDADKEELLKIARTTIECRVKGQKAPEFEIRSSTLMEKRGAFVTINKRGALRGCIGCIEALKPLWQTVREMAEAAALRDPRFPPVQESELEDINIEISVLTPLKKVKDADEIKVGRDGIVIRKGYNQGLLLPQVATEYGWDRTTFLQHTCIKAGLPRDAWKEEDTEIWAFSADVFGEG